MIKKHLQLGLDYIHHRLAVLWLIISESVKAFIFDINFEIAATLTYYGFLSLMPFLLLVFFLLGIFMRSSDAILATVNGMFNAFFPAFTDNILRELIELSHRKTWGVVGIVLLLWAVVPFAGTIRFAMRRIFKKESAANFMVNKLFDIAAVVALLSLFIILVAGKIFYALKADTVAARIGPMYSTLNLIVAPVLVVAGLAFFYLVFCPGRPRFAEILTGSILAAFLLAIMRPLFGLFLEFNPAYGYTFGSLKTIFLILIWIYYTFLVILLGAVVIAVIRRREALLLKGLFRDIHAHIKGLSGVLLDKMAATYKEGENIFHESDKGEEMYFVVEGQVDLIKSGQLLKTIGRGEYFGEMSLLLHMPRTATARVSAPDTQLISINTRNFNSIMSENPDIVLALLREMADRLKSTDYALVAATAMEAAKKHP